MDVVIDDRDAGAAARSRVGGADRHSAVQAESPSRDRPRRDDQGGLTRTSDRDPVGPSSARSMPVSTAPAASRAMSSESGDVNVSSSIIVALPRVATIASTCSCVCTRSRSSSVADRGSTTSPPCSLKDAATASQHSRALRAARGDPRA
jgi:hypothetical protein